MKVFKCKIRQVSTYEGIVLVAVPDEQAAKDMIWVEDANYADCLFDDLDHVITSNSMLSCDPVFSIHEVDPKWKIEQIHTHPSFRPKGNLTALDLLPEMEIPIDRDSWKSEMIESLNHQINSIKQQIEEIKQQ